MIYITGPELHVSSISTVTRQALCNLLDAPHPLGRDWCLLAVQLGLSEKVPKLDIGAGSYSQTARYTLLKMVIDNTMDKCVHCTGRKGTALSNSILCI